jgi:integrase
VHGTVVKRAPYKKGAAPRAKPWAYIIELGGDEAGRRKQSWRSGFRTKREATAAMNEEIGRRHGGSHIEPSRLTVGQFLTEHWLPGLVKIRPSTMRSYQSHVDLYLVPAFDGIRLSGLTTPLINRFYAELQHGTGQRGRRLRPATIRRVHATLHSALADALRWRLIQHNPATGTELPAVRRAEMQVWTGEELGAFLAATTDDPLAMLYRLVAHTGLRRGEAVGLRWSDVDLAAGSVTVSSQHVDVGYEVVHGEPKTRRGHRRIALDPGTAAHLAAHRRRQVERALAAGLPDAVLGFVFARPDGSAYHPDFVTKHFNLLVRRTGLPRIRLHDLRHTHATLGLAAGIPAKVMADRLGHSSVMLTLDIYSHVTPAMDHAAANLIAGLVTPAGDVSLAVRLPQSAFQDQLGAPVLTTFKAKGLVPDTHPLGAGVLGRSGTPVASWPMNEADLLLVIGASFSNHTGIAPWQTIVQVDDTPTAIGRFDAVTADLLGDTVLVVPALVASVAAVGASAEDQRPQGFGGGRVRGAVRAPPRGRRRGRRRRQPRLLARPLPRVEGAAGVDVGLPGLYRLRIPRRDGRMGGRPGPPGCHGHRRRRVRAVRHGADHRRAPRHPGQARAAQQQRPGQDQQGAAGRRLAGLAHLSDQPRLGRLCRAVRRHRHQGHPSQPARRRHGRTVRHRRTGPALHRAGRRAALNRHPTRQPGEPT